MKTRKQIMTEAHQIARTLEGDYTARLSEALKMAWNDSKNTFHFNNVKDVFEAIYNGFNHIQGEYDKKASQVLEVVKHNSKGFQADIAKQAYLFDKKMTRKQAWCVAYEYKNVA